MNRQDTEETDRKQNDTRGLRHTFMKGTVRLEESKVKVGVRQSESHLPPEYEAFKYFFIFFLKRLTFSRFNVK